MQRMVIFRSIVSILNAMIKLLKKNNRYVFSVVVVLSLFVQRDVMTNLQQQIFTSENLLQCSLCFLEIV